MKIKENYFFEKVSNDEYYVSQFQILEASNNQVL